MKKTFTRLVCKGKIGILSLLMVCGSVTMHAQSRALLLEESFDGSTFPENWSINGLGTTNWSITSSNNAGGAANEVLFTYNPQFNGTSRLVTPAIDLTGITSVVFSFKHCLDNYSGSHNLQIATSSDNGNTWNSAWSNDYSSDGQYSINQNVTTSDIGKPNVKFCIAYTGNSYNIDNWYFDDVEIFVPETIDASVDDVILPNYFQEGEVPVKFLVSNKGKNAITSLSVSYAFSGHETVTQEFTSLNILSLQSQELTFTAPMELTAGNYIATVSVTAVNGAVDNDIENNSKTKSISIATQSVQRTVMIEHFSSSTCGPCVSPNQQMLNLLNNNHGKYCIVKYQMNWPGNGDPYYTSEGGVRRNYYGVSAVPQIFWEGGKSTSMPNQSVLNTLYADPAFIDIDGTYSVSGDVINFTFTVTPYITVEDGVRIYAVVSEKTTTENASSNGETSFHHIMMKMVPNAQGIDTSLTVGVPQTYTFIQDMSSTNVEEMSDLEVAIFVQKHSSKYIYNSKFLDDVCPAPSNLSVTPNIVSLDNISANIEWEAPEGSNALQYEVFNGEDIISTTTETSASFTGMTFGQYCFTVRALCADDVVSGNTPEKCVDIICDKPSNLSAEVLDTDVSLVWNSSSALTTSFSIYRDNEVIASGITDTTYVDENVEPGAYVYKVSAVCADETSEFSNSVTVKVGCVTPSELTLTVLSANEIKLNWSASVTASKYNVYCGDSLLVEKTTSRNYTHRNLPAGTHCYTVKAVCANDALSEPTEQKCETLTGIEDLVNTTKVYPIPANAKVQIEGNGIREIVVYDVLGRQIELKKFDSVSNCTIETSSYKQGMYIFNIKFADGRNLSKRIVIAR